MTSILKILTALFIFTIYTSSAGEFKPSTHNWNINPNNEDHQQADTIQVDRISKIKNTYKSNDVSTYNYQLEDIPKLKEMGVSEVFPGGTSFEKITKGINSLCWVKISFPIIER